MWRAWLAASAVIGAALVGGAIPALGQNRATLPSGPGHDTLMASCTTCHELSRITNAGYDRQGWKQTLDRMAALGVRVPADKQGELVDYLAKNFPARNDLVGRPIPGPVKVTIREWDVPTAGSRPHDPMAAPDGGLWWTGQFTNRLGRLDPKTGQMKEYELGVAGSGPHGLVWGPDGRVWFTANFQGYIGALDPRTGKTIEYKLPDPAAKDPHTLQFDKTGVLWFTVQNANMVGRLDPRTGEIKLVRSPTPRSNPYGMVITSKGVPVFDLFGTNAIGAIDPATMRIREYRLPDAGSRPRRIAITPDDVIWYTDYALGRLGRLDLATGKVTEYPSPGGPRSQPYAITALRGAIWYVETNTKPNMLVRFDPKAATFQSWAIPAGGGVVRNMDVTRDGGLALAESGLNKVALATIG